MCCFTHVFSLFSVHAWCGLRFLRWTEFGQCICQMRQVLALDITEELSLSLDTGETRVSFNTECLLDTAASPVGWPLMSKPRF